MKGLKHIIPCLSALHENRRTGMGRANKLEGFRSPTKGPCPGEVYDHSPHFLPPPEVYVNLFLRKSNTDPLSQRSTLYKNPAEKKTYNIFPELWGFSSNYDSRPYMLRSETNATSVMLVCATLSVVQDEVWQIQTLSEVRLSRGNNQ